jgi:alpha-tubulin suppressor-like RCC1 family protein
MSAIKTDGTLWTWGRNNFGQLGLSDTINRSSPVQVGALTNWAKLNETASSAYQCAVIKTDGTLWTWGRSLNGSLGHGNATTYSSPKQVGALTNWASIALSYNNAAALKTDGTLWTWGFNADGQLGLNNRTNYNSPMQVGVATDWSKVGAAYSFALATKTNGTLWSWGRNNYGQLGLNIITTNAGSRSSPTQVGTETYWADVFVGGNTTLAFRTAAAINPA